MRSSCIKTGWAALLLYGCIAILAVTATVQAAHICGLQTSETYVSAQSEGATSPASPFCAMCLLIHSVTALLVLMVSWSPLVKRTYNRSTLQLRFTPVLTSFQLYVRPPPAW
jgi:hypothetical protein